MTFGINQNPRLLRGTSEGSAERGSIRAASATKSHIVSPGEPESASRPTLAH